MTLEPFHRETDFLRRVARRYGLDFVINDNSNILQEYGEYGWEPYRDATSAECSMWRIIVPLDIREKVCQVYHGGDLTLDATIDEIVEAVYLSNKVVYLNPIDFLVLRADPPKDHNFELINERGLLRAGHFATFGDVTIFVSRDIPQGYFLRLDEPDGLLNWLPDSGERQVKPEIDKWKYNIEPLLSPV